MLAPLVAAFNASTLCVGAGAWHVGHMRAALALLLVLVSAPGVGAHMVVLPETSVAGGTERYTILVPTEGESATVRVEVRLPMGVDVAAVESKPGWQASNEAFPIGKATVRWSGGKIPPGEMLSFEFLAVNPPAARVLTWNATQWYEDGSSDRWGEGAPEDHHASTTILRAAAAGESSAGDAGHVPGHAAGDVAQTPPTVAPAAAAPAHGEASLVPLWIALGSLVLSATALLVALGARRR